MLQPHCLPPVSGAGSRSTILTQRQRVLPSPVIAWRSELLLYRMGYDSVNRRPPRKGLHRDACPLRRTAMHVLYACPLRLSFTPVLYALSRRLVTNGDFPGKLKAFVPSLHITVRAVINREGGCMTNGVRSSVIQSIQTLFNEGSVGGMTDGQLLEQFLSRQHERAEIAFAALVSLHGPMVWDVCRSVLSDPHAAEDAFQATFLILVRKAGSIRRRDAVGPWLHGVAQRVAVRTKAVTARQRLREGQGADMSSTPTPDPATREQIEALHEEVDRLAEKYRAPLVLCYFEGCTHAEAARLLKCPVGTVSIRLSRARELLRTRLTRRGLGFPAAWMGAMLGTTAKSSAMPAGLAESTIKAAMHVADGNAITAGAFPVAVTQLAEGEVRTMIFTRLTAAVTGVLAVGFVMGGAGVLALHDPPAQVKSAAAPTARTDEKDQKARRQSIHNLRVLSLAMHNAISTNNQGRFPAAAISKDGKPLLSWRVASFLTSARRVCTRSSTSASPGTARTTRYFWTRCRMSMPRCSERMKPRLPLIIKFCRP